MMKLAETLGRQKAHDIVHTACARVPDGGGSFRDALLDAPEIGDRFDSAALDALLAPEPGALTLSINRRLVAGGVSVSDHDVRRAMIFAWQTLKLVVEPGGAVALAAALSGAVDCRHRITAVVLSGANVDAAVFGKILTGAEAG